MNNKTIDKRDLVMNQGMETLLNLLKSHADDGLCNYIYLDLILGEGIEDYIISIKNCLLKVDGTFKVKRNKNENKKSVYYSMDDLIDSLIFYSNISLREKVLDDRKEEIIKKYGSFVYFSAVEYLLKQTLLGAKYEWFSEYYNEAEKMVKEYILEA